MSGSGRAGSPGLAPGGPRPEASLSPPPRPSSEDPGPLDIGHRSRLLVPTCGYSPSLPFSWSHKVRVTTQALKEGSWEHQALPRHHGQDVQPEGASGLATAGGT